MRREPPRSDLAGERLAHARRLGDLGELPGREPRQTAPDRAGGEDGLERPRRSRCNAPERRQRGARPVGQLKGYRAATAGAPGLAVDVLLRVAPPRRHPRTHPPRARAATARPARARVAAASRASRSRSLGAHVGAASSVALEDRRAAPSRHRGSRPVEPTTPSDARSSVYPPLPTGSGSAVHSTRHHHRRTGDRLARLEDPSSDPLVASLAYVVSETLLPHTALRPPTSSPSRASRASPRSNPCRMHTAVTPAGESRRHGPAARSPPRWCL